jgi:multidrug resistance efflux pump
VIKAEIGGMVALQNVFRNNSMGHAQEGDQLWPGQPLLRIFDPTVMVLDLTVSEADGAVLHPGAKAGVRLDAYPSLILSVHFESASPVASSALGSPLKTFDARFLFEQTDPHLLPDLSAAADIELSRAH